MSDVFNWKLPPAPGFPGYKPSAQPQPQQPTYDQDQRPRPREPFVPSRDDRPYSQWGQPDFALQGAMNYPGMDPTSLMPQIRDFAGLIHGAVMGLGRFGSHYTGMPAIAMGTYANAYWTAYQKGMRERAAQSYEQYRMARQMTIDRGKEEMGEYAKIYAKYYDEKGNITDPEAFHNEILQSAHKYQNKQLIGAITGGHPEQADRILAATDAQIMNLIKATHQEERARKREQREEEKGKEELPPEWGGHGKPGGGDTKSDTVGGAETDDETDENTEPDTESGDDSISSPTRVAEAGAGDFDPAGTRPSRPVSGQPAVQTAQAAPHIATPEEVNQRIDDYAHGELRGEAIPKNIPKSIASRIEARKEDLERQLEDIANSGATGQDMLNKVRKFDPQTARTIEDLASGARAVQPGGIGGGQQALWNRLTSITRAVRPGWGPEVANFRKDFNEANGYSQKVLTNSSSMAEAAKRVLMAMQYIGENDKPPSNWIDQVISKKLTGESRWVNLGTALNVYVEEATRLARSAGGAEADIRRVLEQYAPMGMGPKAIRALLANDAAVASAQVQAQLNRWRSVTGEKNPPLSFDPDSFKTLKSIESIDMMTGQPRPGSPEPPDDLKPLLGRAGSRANERPPPALPADAPKGSRIGKDKNGKEWLVYPDNTVHELN